jgi:hypothetical protein
MHRISRPLFFALLVFTACHHEQKIKSETFKGEISCADCPGIIETLTLNYNFDGKGGVFNINDVYLERDPSTNFDTEGNWKLLEKSNGVHIIQLNSDKPESFMTYFIKDDSTIIGCGKEEAPDSDFIFPLHRISLIRE